MKDIKQKAAKLSLLILLWGIVPLLSVEVIMILLEPYLFKGFFQYDADMGFRVRPYTNGSNQFGFNDRDYPLQKTPGTTRMLVVSDSFNWAGGLEKNYTALLEKKFEERYGVHKVDVINVGYPMTHTAEQLVMLQKYGMQYNPDIVILGFFVGNDFFDASPYRKRIVVNELYIDIDKRRELNILGYPIIPKSRFLLFIEQKYKIITEQMKAKNSPPAVSVNNSPGVLSEETFLNVERTMMKFYNLKSYKAGEYQKEINTIYESISKMADLLNSRNIKFIVAIYPDIFQLNENVANTIFTKYNLNKEDFDLFLAQKILKEFLESKGIPYIDMLSEFRKKGKKQELYLVRDTHWNEAGNQLAADILFKNTVNIVETSAGK